MITTLAHAFPQAALVAGLAGGVMIGFAAALMLLGLGRIAGVSGLLARGAWLSDSGPSRTLALLFAVGLPLGAWLMARAVGGVVVVMPGSVLRLTLAGILVGFGTRLGSGCTSGHGICGLSRLSPRSALATALFMACGFATVAMSHMFD